MALKLTRARWKDILTSLLAAEGELNGLFWGLLTSLPPYSPTLAIGDVVEADYAGYARQAATFGNLYIGSDGKVSATGAQKTWRATDAVTPNNVVALALFSADEDGELLGYDRFAESVGLINADRVLITTTELEFDPSINFGTTLLVT